MIPPGQVVITSGQTKTFTALNTSLVITLPTSGRYLNIQIDKPGIWRVGLYATITGVEFYPIDAAVNDEHNFQSAITSPSVFKYEYFGMTKAAIVLEATTGTLPAVTVLISE